MRKVLLIFTAALVSASAFASPVSAVRAREIAARHFGADASRLSLVFDSQATVSTMGVSDAPYYIFNNPSGEGFVIVAGDDALSPVLAYSNEGSIGSKPLPPAMKFWLGEVGNAVTRVRRVSLPQSPKTRARWEGVPVVRTSASSGKFLNLPKWDQGHPYNWYCPQIEYESGRSMTGCVATAISMVMWYHQWPPCGHGTLPSYTYTYFHYDDYGYTGKTSRVRVDGHNLGHEYKWSQMPSRDISKYSMVAPTAAEKQVAWLMWDCGVMMQAAYSDMGTGAYSEDIPSRLAQYMYYSTEASYVAKDYYGGDWLTLLKDQIDQDLPVIYGAVSPSPDGGGHQFVIQGYDSQDRLYVNWGWGGEANGYFALDNFVPYTYDDLSYLLNQGWTKQEIEDYVYESSLTEGHDAIINLKPDRSFTPTPNDEQEPTIIETPDYIYMEHGSLNGKEYNGIRISASSPVQTITEGSDFSLDAGLLWNPTESTYKGYFRFYQADYQGNLTGPLGAPKSISFFMAGKCKTLDAMSCNASYPIKLGDKVLLYTDPEKKDAYEPLRWTDDGATVGELYLVPMYFIDLTGEKKLLNSNEPCTAVQWAEGADSLKAVISYEDGSTETILREF